jgi:hypothetical protein
MFTERERRRGSGDSLNMVGMAAASGTDGVWRRWRVEGEVR